MFNIAHVTTSHNHRHGKGGQSMPSHNVPIRRLIKVLSALVALLVMSGRYLLMVSNAALVPRMPSLRQL